ncbi:MAG: hypothetical protein HQK51_12470 [Oligoflexia bacterium]|nr:hypothetical protein [Oligoflexia bacterium]
MRLSFIFISLLIFLLTTPSYAKEKDLTLEKLLKNADEIYKKRKDFNQALLAMKSYQEILQKFPDNYEIYSRLAMNNYFVGHHTSEKDKNKKSDYFKEGMEYSRKCVEISKEKSAECFFWLATNEILYRQENGKLSMVFSVSSVIENYERALKLDPHYVSGGSYRMLGILYNRLPGVLGGDNKRSEEYFIKAIETAPDEPLNYMFLSKLYTELGKNDLAKEWVKKGLFKVKEKELLDERYESLGSLEELKYFVKNEKWPSE